MRKNKNFYILGTLILFFHTFCFSQNACNIIYQKNKKKLTINKDTIFFENTAGTKLFLFNDMIYLNKKRLYKFKNVSWYSEVMYLQINSNNYLYIYPIYNEQVGPYIWELKNGIIIKIAETPIVKKKIPYADFSEICQLGLEDYFVAHKKTRK